MRKALWALLLAAALLPFPAYGETAQEITEVCTIIPSTRARHIRLLHDGDYSTSWGAKDVVSSEILITLPQGMGCGGVYLCWGHMPDRWTLSAADGTDAILASGDQNGYAHVYLPADGQTALRLSMETPEGKTVSIQELFVFAPGEMPAWVQTWQPPVQKADLLVLSAHPDDEFLYMGGTIPYYAGELKKRVAVAYMTYSNVSRRSELLNGLWAAGVRNYPVMGQFPDERHDTLEGMYDFWGLEKVRAYVVDLYRRIKPDVVVTHAIRGEYGHGAHMVCADAAQYALGAAADPMLYPESAGAYGVWDLPKLYLHLYKQNAIKMNWRMPLEAFGGETALDVAKQAYSLHTSQQIYRFRVRDSGAFSCAIFGLVRSLVGPDEAKDDFLEHINTDGGNDAQ